MTIFEEQMRCNDGRWKICGKKLLERKKGTRSVWVPEVPDLLNSDNSLSLSLPLFLDFNMSSSGGANCIDVASATTDDPTDCVQWDWHFLWPVRKAAATVKHNNKHRSRPRWGKSTWLLIGITYFLTTSFHPSSLFPLPFGLVLRTCMTWLFPPLTSDSKWSLKQKGMVKQRMNITGTVHVFRVLPPGDLNIWVFLWTKFFNDCPFFFSFFSIKFLANSINNI